MEMKPVKIQAEVQWAFFDKVNDMSGKFQCDLANLSTAAVEALESIGLAPRKREDKPEKGWFLTVKSNYAIQPFDKEGNEIKDVVGNGSKAVALIKPYSWKWKNKEGVSASLSKIVITDLIKYNPEGGDTATIEDLDDDIL
jgi:hypothetical protein